MVVLTQRDKENERLFLTFSYYWSIDIFIAFLLK